MLELVIPGDEYFNEATGEFEYTKDVCLQMEHSLISIAKWEARHHKAYLSRRRDKTYEEMIDYFRCMTINRGVDPTVYDRITTAQMREIEAYLNDPMTATYIPTDNKSGGNSETITAELIYYWMISYNIPPEYRKWHINQLMALINVCGRKNSPPKQRSKNDILRNNARLNAERRAKLNSKG